MSYYPQSKADRAGPGLVASFNEEIIRQVQGDEAGLRSSQEVNLQDRIGSSGSSQG